MPYLTIGMVSQPFAEDTQLTLVRASAPNSAILVMIRLCEWWRPVSRANPVVWGPKTAATHGYGAEDLLLTEQRGPCLPSFPSLGSS